MTPQSTHHPNPYSPLSSLQVSLLDLPDEALTQIISAISPAGPVRRHDIEFGPDSCDLAIACPRLLHLFRTQTLTIIDALFPESYAQYQPRAPDGLLTSQHLVALVRLAGNVLRVLRLPFDQISPHHALAELAIRRIQLEELAYRNVSNIPDVPAVPENIESQFFAHAASQLRVLNIHDPTTVLKYIDNASSLEQLELTGVRPNVISELGLLLPRLGNSLRVLRVVFDAPESERVSANGDEVPLSVHCVNTFAEFVCRHVPDQLSLLHTLDVSAEPSHTVHHDPHADNQESELHPIARKFEESIARVREFNAAVSTPNHLQRLVLRCTSAPLISNMARCIKSFRKLITPNVTIELQAISFTVVLPHDDSPAYFRALQMTLEEIAVFENSIDFDYTRMETLDLGSTRFVTMYSSEEAIRRTVMDIVWQAADVLANLVVEAEVLTSIMMENVCSYVGDVLEIAPQVETVSLRAEIVDFVDKGCLEFHRMMKYMGNIKVLRLLTVRQNGGDCKLAFGRHLPVFLNAVARSCVNLECLFLEPSPPVRPESIASPEIFMLAIKSHRLCMEAVENIEVVIPKCDVTSVRSQLKVWHRDLSALNGLKNFCA